MRFQPLSGALCLISASLFAGAGANTSTTASIVGSSPVLTTKWTADIYNTISGPITVTTTGTSPTAFNQSVTVSNTAAGGSYSWTQGGLSDGHYFVSTTCNYVTNNQAVSSTTSAAFWVDGTAPTGSLDQVNGQWSVTCQDQVGLAKVEFLYNYGAGYSVYKTVQISSTPGTATSWSAPLPMPAGPGQVMANVYDLVGHVTQLPAITLTQTASAAQSWYLPLYANNQWSDIVSTTSDDRILPIRSVAGENKYGMIQAGGSAGKSVRYISVYSSGAWTYTNDAPFEIFGIAGENSHGAIVFGGLNRQQVAYMDNYGTGVWHMLPQAPWPITAIAGNNTTGIVISGGYDNREVYYMTSYASGVWYKATATAPFPIKGIAGDNTNGIVVFGDTDSRHVAYLRQYQGGAYATLPLAPAAIGFIGGNNLYGPMILAGTGNRQFYYLNNYASPAWTQATSIPSFVTPAGVVGDNHLGAAIGGSGN